ncbi:radical SAM protein [uncultured Thiodictyon sp.]|uniref:radical SAM protein n=1 Tax=uncultured Thiodictyon sp. TaxID=1846217 RepID=UPI0025DAA76C|nr:radical SAM protein [uncultured Thiodictyon sp.]
MYAPSTHSIGVVELPELGLFDADGKNRASVRPGSALISKQVLLADLRASGFDAQLVNLKDGAAAVEFGTVRWGGADLTKVYLGTPIGALDPSAYDAWAITNNFSQHRELSRIVIAHLASQGRPLVVGGSDALAEPRYYLDAGACAVVQDKSGAANAAILDHVLGRPARESLTEVVLSNGTVIPRTRPARGPEDWALPDPEVATQCLGREYWSLDYPPTLSPIGSVFTDIGCDRHCDFCQTPRYRLGYRAMSPQRTLAWFELQRRAGAGSVIGSSDQFLGRILRPGGRAAILEIMSGIRALGLAVLWPNGLELKKATQGRSINRGAADFQPDEELISALWGWDGKVGCYHAYIPAERPLAGRENYRKLLPWREHCDLVKAIVRAGLPHLTYGIIIGFADESQETLIRLEEAILTLYRALLDINPKLKFQVSPFSIYPITGTPQRDQVHASGLLAFDDPSVIGGLWTPSVNSHHLSYREIAQWQVRLLQIGSVGGRTHFINTHFQMTTQPGFPQQQ